MCTSAFLHVCMCTTCISGATGIRRRCQISVTVVSHLGDAGNWARVLCKKLSVLLMLGYFSSPRTVFKVVWNLPGWEQEDKIPSDKGYEPSVWREGIWEGKRPTWLCKHHKANALPSLGYLESPVRTADLLWTGDLGQALGFIGIEFTLIFWHGKAHCLAGIFRGPVEF